MSYKFNNIELESQLESNFEKFFPSFLFEEMQEILSLRIFGLLCFEKQFNANTKIELLVQLDEEVKNEILK